MYFIVFIVLRIMGKREIGKLSMFDLVISIMIAEIGVFVLEDLDKSIFEGLVPMLVLVTIQIIMAYVTMKNRRLRILFDGNPSVLIENGMINRVEMKKQKYTIDDLLLQLRENGVRSVAEVDVAVLETNGKLSVIMKEKERPAIGEDNNNKLRTDIRFTGLALPLIMDGEVQEESLHKIHKDRKWLKSQMDKLKLYHIDDVFFCWIDQDGWIFVNTK